MNEQMKNVLIGLFVIGALITTISIILFLEPRVGDSKTVLHVRFTDISGLNIGTRVTLAGRPVGEVTAIEPIKNGRDEPVDKLDRVYFYQLTLRVDSSVKVYDTDEVAVQTTGLLGEKTIGIIPRSLVGKKPQLITTQVIYGNAVEPISYAIHQISNLAGTAEKTIDNINGWFNENKADLRFAVTSFGKAMNEFSLFMGDMNQEHMATAIKDGVNAFTDNMKSLHVSLEKVAKGEGTIGKLVQNDDIYLRMVAVLSKIDTLMNDVNHYGVLFQYDKGWQRMRTKRANTLQALQTPEQFKSYYHKEVDNINTSLARIFALLQMGEEKKIKQQIIQSPAFKKDFACLLKEVEGLMDSLNLYNQQLVEKQPAACGK